MHPRVLLASLAGLALLAVAPETRANGRFPAANHLVAQPGNPNRILLRATFGFVYTEDHGKTWRWMCERAVGYSGMQDPPIALLAGGRTVTALFDGLVMSDPKGCSWSFVKGELDRQVFVDVAARPDAPASAVAITGTNVGGDEAGSHFRTQVFATEDDGATWAALGTPIDPTMIVETVEVAASDPQRLYVTAVRGEDASREGFFFASKDKGAHWTQRKIAMDLALERAPFIAGVDPTNADRVYVRTLGVTASRLLVSDDAGQTFRPVWSGGKMQGFALSADGKKVFLGGQSDGLLVASSTALAFAPRSKIQVECLMTNGSTLYACSNEATGFIVGASEDEGATFATLLRLHTVAGPLPCATGTNGSACAVEWPTMRDTLGVVEDAGSASGTTDGAAGGKPATPAGKTCGCRAAGAGSGPEFLGAGAPWLALAALARRLRRRARGATT